MEPLCIDELTLRRTRNTLAALSDDELIAFGEELCRRRHLIGAVGPTALVEFARRFVLSPAAS